MNHTLYESVKRKDIYNKDRKNTETRKCLEIIAHKEYAGNNNGINVY